MKEATELGEGWEVSGDRVERGLGAKAQDSDEEHLSRVKESQSSGFDRDGFKAI